MRRISFVTVMVLIALLAMACARGAATPILPKETIAPPTPTPTATLQPTAMPTAQPPEAVMNIRWALIEQFRVNPAEVKLVSWEAVEWPDGCLGIQMQGRGCIEAITPGYRLVVEIGGERYEYHSNLDGSLFLLAAGPEIQIEKPVLTWEGEEPEGCQSLTLAADGQAAIGPCGAPQIPLRLSEDMERPQQLEYLVGHFAPFKAETPAGRVTFQGQGQVVVTPAWQRAIAAWARLVRMELQFGRSGASWGAALAWRREVPEHPGYCQFLAVEMYGMAYASVARCVGGDARDLGRRWLETAEWEQFDGWLYGRSPVYLPDLDLFSVGSQEMSESEVDALRRWAEAVYDRLATRGLTVEEYPIVAKGVDTPSHFEYMQRISPTILDRRRAWREPSAEKFVEPYNAVLAAFGYQLVPKEKADCAFPFYDLYKGDTLFLSELWEVWPVSMNGTGDDFAMIVEEFNGPTTLVRRDAVKRWDQSRHAFLPPVFAGDDLVAIETDEQHQQFAVRRGNRTVYSFTISGPRVDNPVKGLWSWMGHWVLEVDGQVLVDGQSLNQELGYDKIFGWRLLSGQPFYLFRKDNHIGVSYAGQVLPYWYDEVIHYRCCEPAAFNVAGNEAMVWFHALRDGMWYYVEMGVYQ